MKILLLFCDMLRTNLLHTVDSSRKKNEVDREIAKLGGTLYTNCYTPAPDTPRSLGALWSGVYPEENGCNTRLRYPNPWLRNPEKTFLTVLEEQGYDFNFLVSEASKNVGVLPSGFEKKSTCLEHESLEVYLKKLQLSDDSLTFLDMEDFHYAINDMGANERGAALGFDLIGKIFQTIDRTIGFDSFDLTIVFSDHGFKFVVDSQKMTGFKLLNSDRTQIFMLVKTRNMNQIQCDHRICSIMDVYATILDAAEIMNPYQTEGCSLLGHQKHPYIMIEDHKNFSAELGQTIEYWGVVNDAGYSVIDCSGNWEASYPITEAEKNEYEEIMKTKMSFFEINRKMQMMLDLYAASVVPTATYFDGSLRKKKIYVSQILKSRCKKIIKGIIG